MSSGAARRVRSVSDALVESCRSFWLSAGVRPSLLMSFDWSSFAFLWWSTIICANFRTRAFLVLPRTYLAASISAVFAASVTAAICSSLSVEACSICCGAAPCDSGAGSVSRCASIPEAGVIGCSVVGGAAVAGVGSYVAVFDGASASRSRSPPQANRTKGTASVKSSKARTLLMVFLLGEIPRLEVLKHASRGAKRHEVTSHEKRDAYCHVARPLTQKASHGAASRGTRE